MVKLYSLYKAGNTQKASELNKLLFNMYQSLFCETNPCPVKKALELQNMCANQLRLPLSPVSDENKQKIDRDLKETLRGLEEFIA